MKVVVLVGMEALLTKSEVLLWHFDAAEVLFLDGFEEVALSEVAEVVGSDGVDN